MSKTGFVVKTENGESDVGDLLIPKEKFLDPIEEVGRLYCTGMNDCEGGLGLDNNKYYQRFKQPDNECGSKIDTPMVAFNSYVGYFSFPNIVDISAGWDHVAIIGEDGVFYAWGNNNNGQLGFDSYGQSVELLTKMDDPNSETNPKWEKVKCAGDNTYAIKTDGTLWCWGSLVYGQIGNNTNDYSGIDCFSSPVQTICGGNNWKQVSACYNRVFGLKTDGTLWAWGNNYDGALGLGDTYDDSSPETKHNRSSPTQIGNGTDWAYVDSAEDATFAIKTDGTLWAWGDNTYHTLGSPDALYYGSISYPVQVLVFTFEGAESSPVQVSPNNDWVKVRAASDGVVYGLKTDGSLWTWGDQQLIYNSICPVKMDVFGTKQFKDIQCGYYSTFVVDNYNNVYCWGKNESGQLGIGNYIDTSASGGYSFNYKTPLLKRPGENIIVSPGINFTCFSYPSWE